MFISKVLMVDDDPAIRKIGEMSLRGIGKWDVSSADSGIRALELAEQFRPDVILLDVGMPLMDGPTTLRMLKSAEADLSIAVIFLTAVTEKDEIERLLLLDPAGVISKPFDPITLPQEIRRICDQFAPISRVA